MNKTPLLYKICKVVLGFVFKLYYNPTIIGKENIPEYGPIIVAGNHVHLFDQCLTIISTKRYLCYMAKKEYFDNKKIDTDKDGLFSDKEIAEFEKNQPEKTNEINDEDIEILDLDIFEDENLEKTDIVKNSIIYMENYVHVCTPICGG